MKTMFKLGLAILLGMALFISRTALAAGVTLITHGLNGNTDGWVSSMADQITKHPLFAGNNSTTYLLFFNKSGSMYSINWSRTAGSLPSNSDSGEILIKLDWRDLANNDWSTDQIAPAVASALTSANFVSEPV